ncbi:DUF5686 family protein [Sphingobacterium hungaricum]
MRRERLVLKYIVFTIFIFYVSAGVACGQELLKGKIINESTGEGIAGATITLSPTVGTSSDSLGNFSIPTTLPFPIQLKVNALGFRESFSILRNSQHINVYLEETDNLIETIEISRKRKYSNRNNPAVELIDQVIKHKAQNRLSGIDKIQFDQYNKIKFGFVNPRPIFKNNMGQIKFFFQNIDSTSFPGKELLTVYQEENLAKAYSQKNPANQKKIVYRQEKTEFDKRYVNNPNIESYINYLFQEVDVYDESIFIINKLLLSPIADNAKIYYKYYIIDTLVQDNKSYIKLAFEPRNPEDLLFRGTINISMDEHFAVKEARLKMDQQANLNWVNQLDINLNYQPHENGRLVLVKSQAKIIFGVGKSDAVFGERIAVNSKYDLQSEIPNTVFQGAPLEYKLEPDNQQYTDFKRPIALSSTELKTYQNVDSLNNTKAFKRLLSVGYLIGQGYHNLGAFELGPLEYAYSFNELEGNRIRLGGRTTDALSDKVYFEGYAAYGTKDETLKYFLRSAVSLNGSSVSTFPAHYLEGLIQSDVFEPGKGIGFKKGDSFFESFRSNKPFKFLETEAFRLRHVIEFGNHVSFTTGFTHQRRAAAGDLQLLSSAAPHSPIDPIVTSDAHVTFRWAPNEKFYYRNLTRSTIVEKYPVFTVQYNKGIPNFLDANYGFDALRAMVSKRLFMNQLGFADITLSGGKIWGTLPYPLLEMPNVKDEFDRHEVDFDLMRSMEFAADQFAKFSFIHQAQGYFFNKIPLFKRLKLREIWGTQLFYGQLSDRNNPYLSDEVVEFDKDENGTPYTQIIGKKPYWEASAGIDNILNVLRVEYVRRLNYTDLPNVNKDRIRVSLNLNF